MTRIAVRGDGHQRGHEQQDRTRVVIAEDSVLLRKVGAHKPDVAIIDVRMPPTHRCGTIR